MFSVRPKLAFFAVVFAVSSLAACEQRTVEPESRPKSSAAEPAVPDPTELGKEDLKVGEGDREVKTGDEINVLYVGRLFKTNAKFDSKEKKEDPFKFTVGKEEVIKGWDQGVVGMKKGGKRKLVIPAPLAYGEKGKPPKIPPNAPLTFEIELVGWADEKDAADKGADDKDAGKKDEPKKDEPKKDEPKKDEPKKAPAGSAAPAPAKKDEPKK
jgi:hypothetical protein